MRKLVPVGVEGLGRRVRNAAGEGFGLMRVVTGALGFSEKSAATKDKSLLSVPKTQIQPDSYLAEEVKYLTHKRGYKWLNQQSLGPRF